ncbi:small integral membrane protein 29-like [Mytilus trossulus]|uniref:small integral membrane protein 29-like n=1 Tax=Mytilus trossulus TaxID=6551 RepID=UPI003005DC4D
MSSTSSNNVPYHIVTENVTEHTTVLTEPHSTSSSHVLAYVLVPVGSVILVALLALIAVIIFRKNRMDKLRHHLMPMYSFDPNEDADWESELLEDQDNEQRLALRIETPSPDGAPIYKFGTKRK